MLSVLFDINLRENQLVERCFFSKVLNPFLLVAYNFIASYYIVFVYLKQFDINTEFNILNSLLIYDNPLESNCKLMSSSVLCIYKYL